VYECDSHCWALAQHRYAAALLQSLSAIQAASGFFAPPASPLAILSYSSWGACPVLAAHRRTPAAAHPRMAECPSTSRSVI